MSNWNPNLYRVSPAVAPAVTGAIDTNCITDFVGVQLTILHLYSNIVAHSIVHPIFLPLTSHQVQHKNGEVCVEWMFRQYQLMGRIASNVFACERFLEKLYEMPHLFNPRGEWRLGCISQIVPSLFYLYPSCRSWLLRALSEADARLLWWTYKLWGHR